MRNIEKLEPNILPRNYELIDIEIALTDIVIVINKIIDEINRIKHD